MCPFRLGVGLPVVWTSLLWHGKDDSEIRFALLLAGGQLCAWFIGIVVSGLTIECWARLIAQRRILPQKETNRSPITSHNKQGEEAKQRWLDVLVEIDGDEAQKAKYSLMSLVSFLQHARGTQEAEDFLDCLMSIGGVPLFDFLGVS